MAAMSAVVLLRARSLVLFDCYLPVLLNNRRQFIRNPSILRYCSGSDNVVTKIKDLNDTAVSKKPEKKVEETKITLYLPDNSLIVTDLENANKIAKRRCLILIKVEDVQKKTARPVYKLINQTERMKQELDDEKKEKESAVKSIKTIQISSKITLHDLHVKLKNVNKLLERDHKVKIILVNGSNMQEKVIRSIEVGVKNLGTIQKIERSASTIFTITPTSNSHDESN